MKNRIREILDHQGRSIAWLAERTGYHHVYISNVCRGRHTPSAEFHRKCSLALDLPESVLFFASDRPAVNRTAEQDTIEPVAV